MNNIENLTRTLHRLETASFYLSQVKQYFLWNMVGLAYSLFAVILGTLYGVDIMVTLGHYGIGASIGVSIGLSVVTRTNRKLLKRLEDEKLADDKD